MWGLAWGLGWTIALNLLANTPIVLQAERALQRQVWRWRGPQAPPETVAIVGIDGRIEGREAGNAPDFSLERSNYAALTVRLLKEGGARTVVLNLPGSFVVPQTLGDADLDAPLRRVVEQHPDRLLLATRTSESFSQIEIPIFNHFMPFSFRDLQYIVPPEWMQGFMQFRSDSLGIVRQIQVREEMVRRDSQRLQPFWAVEALAIAKAFPHRRSLIPDSNTQLFYKPWGPSGQIPIVPIEAICPPQPIDSCLAPPESGAIASLRDKIVLVGFVGGSPEVASVRAADGSQLAAVELQAQVLSSLLQQQVYREVDSAVAMGVVAIAGVGTGLLLTAGINLKSTSLGQQLRRRSLVLRIAVVTTAIAGYSSAGIAALWWGQWLWPLALPVLVGTATAICTILTVVLLHNRDRLQAQQRELEILRQAEQEAAIHQARKLLYRVATDIHDRELQELKLAMDELELLQWQDPNLKVDGLLDQLEHIGAGIRSQLNDARMLASKVGISANLKEGLHRGIADHIGELMDEGCLTIEVKQNLPPLQEPHTSDWFDAREDIFRFAREAIANVMHHVHPPRGSATYMHIELVREGNRCLLQVTNDGVELVPAKKGGYGTKAMNTIAEQLPNGQWERQHLADGRTVVSLKWDLQPD